MRGESYDAYCATSLKHDLVEAIEICEVGHVTHDADGGTTDLFHGRIELRLATAGNNSRAPS